MYFDDFSSFLSPKVGELKTFKLNAYLKKNKKNFRKYVISLRNHMKSSNNNFFSIIKTSETKKYDLKLGRKKYLQKENIFTVVTSRVIIKFLTPCATGTTSKLYPGSQIVFY